MKPPPLEAASGPVMAEDAAALLAVAAPETASPALVVYERKRGDWDWNYPWCLSGSVYRVEDAKAVFGAVRTHFGAEGVGHPNVFEGHGQRLIKEGKALPQERGFCCCLSRPAVVVV